MQAGLGQQIVKLWSTVAALRSEGRGKQITVLSVFAFLYTGVQMSFPVLLPYMRGAYALDLALAGFLLSVLWLVKAASQLPAGVLSDQIGEGTTLTVSAALGCVSLLLIVAADHVLVLFVATSLFGIGVSFQAMGRYSALSDLYPDRIGTATGVSLASADAGQSILPPLAGIIAVSTVWQAGFGFTIPLLLVSGLALWRYIPTRSSTPLADSSGTTTVGMRPAIKATVAPPVLLGTAILAVYLSLWVAFSSFYPTYLIEVKAQSATVTSVLFGLFFAFGVLVKPLAGTAFDNLDVGRSFVVVGGVSGIALIGFPLAQSTFTILLLTVLVAPVLGSGTIAMSLILEELPEEVQGSGFGLIRTVTMLFASISPVVFGFIADRGFFDEGFVALGLLALTMIPLAHLVSRGQRLQPS